MRIYIAITYARFWISVISCWRIIYDFMATYRTTRRQPERFVSIDVLKRISATRGFRTEVNRYTSSAGSFIIPQGINLVSVRVVTEGRGGGYLFGHVCTAFSGR